MSVIELTLRDADGCTFVVRYDWTITPAGDDECPGIIYDFTDGNFSCDCNRAALIREQCDPAYPALRCGETLRLMQFTIDGEAQEL